MERNGRFAGFFAHLRIWAPVATATAAAAAEEEEEEEERMTTTRRLCFEFSTVKFHFSVGTLGTLVTVNSTPRQQQAGMRKNSCQKHDDTLVGTIMCMLV